MKNNKVSDSLIRIELITHFHRYPGVELTPLEMAEATGRDAGRVEHQMKKLVLLHILEERPLDGENRYRYIPPLSVAAFTMKRSEQRKKESNEFDSRRDEIAG